MKLFSKCNQYSPYGCGNFLMGEYSYWFSLSY